MVRMFVEAVICFSIYIRYIRYCCVGLFKVSNCECMVLFMFVAMCLWCGRSVYGKTVLF